MYAFNARKLLTWMRCQPLLRRCSWLLPGGRARRPVPARTAPVAEGEAQQDERPRGCGWFDSSHDLQQGLRVQEHASADGLARELPLGAWLELSFSGWCAATPAAAPQAADAHAL